MMYTKVVGAVAAVGLFLLSGAAKAQTCYLYRINIQGAAAIGDSKGNISSAQDFAVDEVAIFRDIGVKDHPIEFVLSSLQSLNASQIPVGAIELMTNTAFARNAGIASAALDLGVVTQGQTTTFQLDPGASFQLPSPNVFVAPGIASAPGGLGGLGFLPNGSLGDLGALLGGSTVLSVSYIIPRQGDVAFSLPNSGSNIQGRINLKGSLEDNTSFTGFYQATFFGSFSEAMPCN